MHCFVWSLVVNQCVNETSKTERPEWSKHFHQVFFSFFFEAMHLCTSSVLQEYFTNGASAGAQIKWCQKTSSGASRPSTEEGGNPIFDLMNDCKSLCT